MSQLRTRYLMAYDITSSKRLYRIHKKVEAYAIGGQKSFYECWLTKYELEQFMQEINQLILVGEDRFFIFQLPKETNVLLYGKAYLQSIQPFLLV